MVMEGSSGRIRPHGKLAERCETEVVERKGAGLVDIGLKSSDYYAPTPSNVDEFGMKLYVLELLRAALALTSTAAGGKRFFWLFNLFRGTVGVGVLNDGQFI